MGLSSLRLAIPLCVFAVSAGAQEFRGTILGRVTDPSAAPVPAAAIEAVNVDTGVSISSAANDQGNYQIPFLVPGNYTVRVEHSGFKRAERTGIRVATNTQVTLDFALELGATAETVTVNATAPLLNTASADLGQVVERNYLQSITVNLTRNVLNTVRLTPGVTGGGATVTGNNSGSFSISGGGSTVGRIEFLVDGIPNTTAHNNGGVVFIPSIDAVEEIKVHTTMFDAQYGHSNGGAINITTRGGTNQLHGTSYLYKRWSALDANSWTNNSRGQRKPPTSYYQFGYLVGGPVILPKIYNGRNRTFFSTTFERDRDSVELTRRARVPTQEERVGDFSQTINRRGGPFTLFDPSTTTVANNRATRTPFPGNRIPSSRIPPVGGAWLKLYPNPNVAIPPQLEALNWIGTDATVLPQTQVSIRGDHNLSDRQRMFGRVGILRLYQTNGELIRGQYSIAPEGTGGLARANPRRFYNIGFDDTYTFSPSFLGSFRYGFVRKVQENLRGGFRYDPAPLNIPPAITGNQAIPGWPTFNIAENMPTLGSNYVEETNDQHSAMASFTKLTGKHSLKWGVDWRVLRWHRNSPGDAATGSFTFDTTFTRSDPFTPTSADTSGTGMASILLGIPASGSIGYISSLSLQNHYLAGFVQEDWKVSQRLTLNFGLRYELETPYTERFNRMSYGFDETARLPVTVPGLNLAGGIRFAGVDGNSRRGGLIDGNNFGPRFGFAFSLNPKTVVRGGYGTFFSGQAFNTGFLADVGVFNATTPYVGTVDNGATPFTTLANPFPQGFRGPVGAAAGTGAQLGDAIAFFDERRVSPYNQQWQFSVQRQLPSQILAEAAYVGMLSLKQFESFNLNERPDQFLALGTAENTRVTNPFLGVLPANSVLGQGATIVQSRLWPRFPQFTNVTLQGANTGRAIYHALQLKADKRMTRGLSVLWSYTYSKLIDNETTSVINPRKYRTVSSLDQRHIMRVAATYEFPWSFAGSGVNRILRQVAGGWAVSGYATGETGVPLGVTHPNGRPVRLRSPALSGPAGERLGDRLDSSRRVANPYFDITAFAPLASQYVVTPEAARFDELRAPGSKTLNVSLFKTFPLNERFRLQIRMEASGVTNSPNFGAPGTNMASVATFGMITAASGARQMQGSARVYF
ncbi:MAG: carboxypeptidase regulatory-like domain-containing protein [Acidobacteria bacterium]|nr:carboxypeptidase regulatory-like domain-containing protein [Acidobacteriota bacterium]